VNIQSLSTSERIQLAEQLWESVRNNADEVNLSKEQVQLLNERLDAFQKDNIQGDSWQSVKTRISNLKRP